MRQSRRETNVMETRKYKVRLLLPPHNFLSTSQNYRQRMKIQIILLQMLPMHNITTLLSIVQAYGWHIIEI